MRFPRVSLNRLLARLKTEPADAPAGEGSFAAPPFDSDLAGAVALISTRLSIRADEASRQAWQAECNQVSATEISFLAPVLANRPKPHSVLEIGPGLGRSVIAFRKAGFWDDTAAVVLYEGTGQATKYKQRYYDDPPKWPDTSSFCGNVPMLRRVLEHNGIENYSVVDAHQVRLGDIGRQFDLIYALYSVGFHWSLEHYLADIDRLLAPGGLFLCTLNKNFRELAGLKKFETRILPMDMGHGRKVNILLLERRTQAG